MENNPANTPQPQPQTTPQPDPAQQPPLTPQQPVDTNKVSRTGWILFSVSVVLTIAGLLFGVALAASAIIAAYAGRLGLQVKNKGLAITAITFAGLNLLLFIAAVLLSQ
jgi:hypothetical protein